MSDLLIKGVKMPESCYCCPMHSYMTNWCDAVDKNLVNAISEETHRAEWCPLVEIPQHGRLIDAEAFKHRVRDRLENSKDALLAYGKYVTEAICLDIDEQPTIIEAEDGA